MTNKYLKDMFNMMKGLGHYSQYKDYSSYRRAKYGKPSLEEWQDSEGFTDDDKADFKDVFGE